MQKHGKDWTSVAAECEQFGASSGSCRGRYYKLFELQQLMSKPSPPPWSELKVGLKVCTAHTEIGVYIFISQMADLRDAILAHGVADGWRKVAAALHKTTESCRKKW